MNNLINLKTRRIQSSDDFFLDEIRGKINSDKLNFVAFHFYIRKKDAKLELVYNNPASKVHSLIKSIENPPIAAINAGFFVIATKKPLDWFVYKKNEVTEFRNNQRPCIVFFDDNISIEMPDDIDRNIHSYDNLLQAGPLLIKDSSINIDYSDYIEKAYEFDSDITAHRHPRSIFGISDGYYHFIAVDGRSLKSAGLFMEESAELCQKLGIKDAINLDGGASSVLICNKRRINHPRFSIIGKSRIFSAPVPLGGRKIPSALFLYEKTH